MMAGTAARQAEHIAAMRAVSVEDEARADWYALFAALFSEPPSEARVARLAQAADCRDDSELGQAWKHLGQAVAIAGAPAIRAEFDDTFVGVGKAPVLPFASYYLSGFLNERPLVELRAHLAALGIGKRDDGGTTEDHIATICDVMSYLIRSDDPVLSQIATQRQFFSRFIAPWFEAFCDSVDDCDCTQVYKHVGRVLRIFLSVDRQAFDFDG